MLTAPWWKTWQEMKALSEDKAIILYGRSEDWIPKTLRKLPREPSYIVDKNPGYHGQEYAGIPVQAPESLLIRRTSA